MAATKLTIDIGDSRSQLEKIVSQIAANKVASKDATKEAHTIDAVAAKIDKAEDAYAVIPVETRTAAVEMLRSLAQLMAPTATVYWTEGDLERHVSAVRLGLLAGAFEDADVVEKLLSDAEPNGNGTAGPARQRAVRVPENIEGRPVYVRIKIGDAWPFSDQKGNGKNSVGNIAGAIERYFDKNLHTPLTDDEVTAVRDLVRESIENGKDHVEAGTGPGAIVIDHVLMVDEAPAEEAPKEDAPAETPTETPSEAPAEKAGVSA